MNVFDQHIGRNDQRFSVSARDYGAVVPDSKTFPGRDAPKLFADTRNPTELAQFSQFHPSVLVINSLNYYKNMLNIQITVVFLYRI